MHTIWDFQRYEMDLVFNIIDQSLCQYLTQ